MIFHEPKWRGISQDAVRLEKGMTSFKFFNEGHDESTIIKQTENELLSEIFNNSDFLSLILDEAKLTDYSYILKNVPTLNIIGKGGGDFDLILYSNSYPYNVTCIEFKRIKIIANDSERDKINKLSGIQTLSNQLSDRIRLGFHKVFGVIIIHSDLRNRKTNNTIFRSVSKETITLILENLNNTKNFPIDAGLLFLRYEQPTGKKYSLNFKVGLVKEASINMQSENLRLKFNDLINSAYPR